MAEKQYGLILPKSKQGASNAKKPIANVFGQDSSSEDEETKAVVSGGTDWMKRKIASGSSVNSKSGATGLNSKITTQHMRMKEKALEEDPTIFQYDEVFDQMEATKVEQSGKKKVVDKKPKYITNLLKQAEIRNQEEERRKERKVQKEREAEGDEFADKEKFVTSAYRKKMEEMQKLEEEDKKRQAMEEILDVTKQKDMSGFYRHLYRQTMGEEKGQKVKPEIKEEIKTEIKEEIEETERSVEDKSVRMIQKTKPKERSYRQRRDSEPIEEKSENESNSNSSDSSDEERLDEKAKETTEADRIEKERIRREELRKQKEKRERRKKRIEAGRDTSSEEEESENEENPSNISNNGKDSAKTESNKENSVPSQPKKPKVDIWKKVTVGQVFEDALERYLMRKSERGSRFPW